MCVRRNHSHHQQVNSLNNSRNNSGNDTGKNIPTVSRHLRGDVWSWALGALLGLTIGALLLVVVPLWMSGALTTQNKPKVQTETQTETQADAQQTQQPTDSTNTVAKLNTADKANTAETKKDTPQNQQTQQSAEATTEATIETKTETKKDETTQADNKSANTVAKPNTTEAKKDVPAAITKTATIPPALSGQEVYLTRCSGCHTMNGRGGIGSKLDKVAALSWDVFATAVRNAPTVGGSAEGSNAAGTNMHNLNLSETQLKAVYAYLNEIY